MKRLRSGNIDVAPQDLNQIQAEPREIEKGSALFELDQEVNVALGACFTACDRAEDACTHDSPLTHDVSYLPPNLRDRWTHEINLVGNQGSAPFPVTVSSRSISGGPPPQQSVAMPLANAHAIANTSAKRGPGRRRMSECAGQGGLSRSEV